MAHLTSRLRCRKLLERKELSWPDNWQTDFSCGVIPSDWEESFILNLYTGNEALDHGSYRSLKLIDQSMKLLGLVPDSYICEMINIDEMQFGFVHGRGTIDGIFIVRQLQEKYITANKLLYFAFFDLVKAFDRVPRKVLW